MLKNIIFALLYLATAGFSQPILAAEQTPVDAVPKETIPAQTIPATAPDKEAVKQRATKAPPINDKHIDYRYCLELKTNREISECRYKKK